MTTDVGAERVLAFYSGQGRDDANRTFEQVLAMDDEEFEHRHDFVQWLFPLTVPSLAVPSSPVVSEREVALFRTDPGLRSRVERALERMLGFYGLVFRTQSEQVVVERLPSYPERSRVWLERPHNFKRLTRMLESLGTLGFERHAQALFACLEQTYLENPTQVGATSRGFWKRAVS